MGDALPKSNEGGEFGASSGKSSDARTSKLLRVVSMPMLLNRVLRRLRLLPVVRRLGRSESSWSSSLSCMLLAVDGRAPRSLVDETVDVSVAVWSFSVAKAA